MGKTNLHNLVLPTTSFACYLAIPGFGDCLTSMFETVWLLGFLGCDLSERFEVLGLLLVEFWLITVAGRAMWKLTSADTLS